MPDRYGERPDPELGDDEPPATPEDFGPTQTEIRLAAIQACDICDEDGYRGATVCDHIDRTNTAARGINQVRQAMGWK